MIRETKGWKSDWLNGIWASVPTPLHENGALKLGAIPGLVAHFRNSLGLEGIYCNGIMGEGWSLTLEERKTVVAHWVGAADQSLKVGVVVTAGSLGETLALARHAHEVQAHHIVIAPPPGHYSPSELVGYLRCVHDAVPLPLVLVQTSSRGFDIDVLRELISGKTIISAAKIGASQGDLGQLFAKFGNRITITDPLEANWLSNITEFGMGLLYADPEPYLYQVPGYRPIESYHRAAVAGDISAARTGSDELRDLRDIYDRWIMQPLLSGVAPIGALKAWCEFLGMDVGPPRRPLQPLEADERDALYSQLAEVRTPGFQRQA